MAKAIPKSVAALERLVKNNRPNLDIEKLREEWVAEAVRCKLRGAAWELWAYFLVRKMGGNEGRSYDFRAGCGEMEVREKGYRHHPATGMTRG